MANPFRRDTIDNWVSDFCESDAVLAFSPATREHAAPILAALLERACDVRDVEPADIEEGDLRPAVIEHVARFKLPDAVRGETPELCAAFLTQLELQGRLAGGRRMGAYIRAMRDSFEQAASGKPKPIVNPGSKLSRNDPCPCGSGKKYKKCCMGK